MEEIQVTCKWAIRVWWSWAWRAAVWTFPTAFLLGFCIGIVVGIIGVDPNSMGVWFQLLGVCIGVFFAIFTLKTVLSKKFNGYRLALIKTAPDEVSE